MLEHVGRRDRRRQDPAAALSTSPATGSAAINADANGLMTDGLAATDAGATGSAAINLDTGNGLAAINRNANGLESSGLAGTDASATGSAAINGLTATSRLDHNGLAATGSAAGKAAAACVIDFDVDVVDRSTAGGAAVDVDVQSRDVPGTL